jgi:nickel-dependent lactate racemase
MLASTVRPEGGLAESDVREAMREAFSQLALVNKRVLVIIPDGTRTAPIPLIFRLMQEILGPQAAALDFLVALGTHPPMTDEELSELVGVRVEHGRVGGSTVFNHRWDQAETFTTLGTLSAARVEAISGGRLSIDVPVRLNKLVLQYDQLLVCGPVFPHEVVGFSGGNKYFVPGIAGQEVIDVTHWLGALITSLAVIGVPESPVREMIDRATSLIPTPRQCLAMVMEGESLHGLYVGGMQEMYDDIWTGAKGMYKLEPVVADGGEVIIYAPHIAEFSYTHGEIIEQVGYHVRDYFVKQWDRFRDYPWGVLAHATHLRGVGTYVDGVEEPRIKVTLATSISAEGCKRVNLGYRDPATINPPDWGGRRDEGVLLVPHAGEMLYRLKKSPGHLSD